MKHSNLMQHLQWGVPLRIDACNKRLALNSDLKQHLCTRTGAMYVIAQDSVPFCVVYVRNHLTNKGNLREHLRVCDG